MFDDFFGKSRRRRRSDPFGFSFSPQSDRSVGMRLRQRGGYGAESLFKAQHVLAGDRVRRAPRGQDFKVEPVIGWRSKGFEVRPRYGRAEYHEVKTSSRINPITWELGPVRLSPLQKKTRRRVKKKGRKYVIDRYPRADYYQSTL